MQVNDQIIPPHVSRMVRTAAGQTRASIKSRAFPFILRAFGCDESRTVRVQVRHTRKGGTLVIEDFTFPILDGHDMIAMPGMNAAIDKAITLANSVEHMGRDVI